MQVFHSISKKINVGKSLIGKDSFQEVDITGITMPITKTNYIVKRAEDLADIIREAFAIARSGRPGPVLIDILKNATAEEADYEPLKRGFHQTEGRQAAWSWSALPGKRRAERRSSPAGPEPEASAPERSGWI
jgi:hypothetical protein